jgi:hypothetical protein
MLNPPRDDTRSQRRQVSGHAFSHAEQRQKNPGLMSKSSRDEVSSQQQKYQDTTSVMSKSSRDEVSSQQQQVSGHDFSHAEIAPKEPGL